MTSFYVECGRCGATTEPAPRIALCRECGSPQLVRYPLSELAAHDLRPVWSARPAGMWRYQELLPLRCDEEPVTLGEGGTPLLRLRALGSELGLDLFLKDEGRNPTGSFKDRGVSTAVTRAVLDGVRSFVISSAGNAAAALAAYAARAGVPARVYIPSDTPSGVIRRCRAFGAEVIEVKGLITDCARLAAGHAEHTGAFDLSTLNEPYRIEGKKTMMLETVEALEWRPPDAMVYPTGGGTGLIGAWKVLQELRELGLVRGGTRMYAVQSAGCAPIVRAWSEGKAEAATWTRADTEAWGLRVPAARGDFLILRVLRDTTGGAIAVTDDDMRAGSSELGAREGINAIIEGGASLAAARALRRAGELADGELVVLFNTGNMLAY